MSSDALIVLSLVLFTIGIYTAPLFSMVLGICILILSGIIFTFAITPNQFNIETTLKKIFSKRALHNRIRKFYRKNKLKYELYNNNIYLKLTMKNNSASFYCINKKSQKGTLERFIMSPSQITNENIMTQWAYFNMEFNENTTMKDLINIQKQLGFYKGTVIRRQMGAINREKYKLYFVFDNKPYICCKKISSSKRKKKRYKAKYKNTYFIINGDLETMYDIYYSVAMIHTTLNNYESLLALLSERKDCKIEIKEYHKSKQKTKDNKTNLIDINYAIETDLTKLPGVNIILAKRIVQQREIIDGFKNKEEFYDFCKLKPHFIEQIDNLITVGEFDILEVILRKEEERTVDTIDDYDDVEDNITDYDNDITVDL